MSNSEFLTFVRGYPQWQRSHIAKDLHDGDYLKHWGGDEIIPSQEMELPVRYISYHAALAYCQAIGETLPRLAHFLAAAMHKNFRSARGMMYFTYTYEKPYKPSEFNFVSEEWTGDPSSTRVDTNEVIVFSLNPFRSQRSHFSDKRHTGKSLGFRCAYKEP